MGRHTFFLGNSYNLSKYLGSIISAYRQGNMNKKYYRMEGKLDGRMFV